MWRAGQLTRYHSDADSDVYRGIQEKVACLLIRKLDVNTQDDLSLLEPGRNGEGHTGEWEEEAEGNNTQLGGSSGNYNVKADADIMNFIDMIFNVFFKIAHMARGGTERRGGW